MIERSQIREKIPYGYCKVIAAKAGVTQRYVSKYLNDSSINSKKVQMATLEVLEEIKESKKEIDNRFRTAIS